MLSTLFHALFYNPIYNLLVALVAYLPGESVGLAVIVLTLLIQLVLLPFSLSAARTQRAMKALQPLLKELQEKHKHDKETQAVKTLELYREKRVRPFASFVIVLIQLPILLALYWVFRYEPFTTLDLARLYPFTPHPSALSLIFFGVNLAGKSLILAVLAGLAQYLQASVMLSGVSAPVEGMQADFYRAMNLNMKYVFPVIFAVISYTTSAAIGLYFITINLARTLQELYVRRRFAKENEAVNQSA